MRKTKKPIAILAMLFVSVSWTLAQTTAGSVPNGMSITNSNVNLSVSTSQAGANMPFGIDCDGMDDISIKLYKGNPSFDLPNSTSMYLLNPLFEICSDTGAYSIPSYYNLGDTLLCVGNREWKSDSINYLGNYGCFGCTGPATISNMYLAYRIGSQVGWIKISYDIDDMGVSSAPITMSIPEVLSPCTVNSLQQIQSDKAFYLTPNPTLNGNIEIHCLEKINSIEVVSMMGQFVKVIEVNSAKIKLPDQKGIYIIRVWGEKGGYWHRRILRQ